LILRSFVGSGPQIDPRILESTPDSISKNSFNPMAARAIANALGSDPNLDSIIWQPSLPERFGVTGVSHMSCKGSISSWSRQFTSAGTEKTMFLLETSCPSIAAPFLSAFLFAHTSENIWKLELSEKYLMIESRRTPIDWFYVTSVSLGDGIPGLFLRSTLDNGDHEVRLIAPANGHLASVLSFVISDGNPLTRGVERFDVVPNTGETNDIRLTSKPYFIEDASGQFGVRKTHWSKTCKFNGEEYICAQPVVVASKNIPDQDSQN